MKDTQKMLDIREIDIQKVGVNRVRLPFQIRTKTGVFQTVLANIRLTVEVPRQFKGTHMSRFVEALSVWSQKPMASDGVEAILDDIMDRLDSQSAHMEMSFTYFIEKSAPVSGSKALMDYECSFSGGKTRGGDFEFVLGVSVPMTSLCPCSKEISSYGAHNQRGEMRAQVRYERDAFVWIEDLISLMEAQASSPVYSLLKREDEKFVTEKAYENPKFVEDIIRDLVLTLRALPGLTWFEIECENFESIHNHSAYAIHAEEVKVGSGR